MDKSFVYNILDAFISTSVIYSGSSISKIGRAYHSNFAGAPFFTVIVNITFSFTFPTSRLCLLILMVDCESGSTNGSIASAEPPPV